MVRGYSDKSFDNTDNCDIFNEKLRGGTAWRHG